MRACVRGAWTVRPSEAAVGVVGVVVAVAVAVWAEEGREGGEVRGCMVVEYVWLAGCVRACVRVRECVEGPSL